MTGSPTSEMAALLRPMPMFELLDDDQLRWLAERAELRRLPAGAVLITEDRPPSGFWFLVEGEIELRRHIGGVDVRLVAASQPGAWAGVIPYVSDTSRLTAVLTVDSRLVRLPDEAVVHMLDHGFPIARHLLNGVTAGAERFGQRVAERERLAALGRLSAGLAHELNNPASAARRAVDRAREVVADVEESAVDLVTTVRESGGDVDLRALADTIERRRSDRQPVSGLERADLEDRLADELADLAYPDPDEGAAILVDAGLDLDCLTELVTGADPGHQRAVVAWAVHRAELTTLLHEASVAAGRVAGIVGKVKEYSYRDRAPDDEADVRRGIDDTLAVLRAKLERVSVERDYDDVPPVTGSGGELNQVWTNLLDNAADAVAGVPDPRIAVRVKADGPSVVVAVEDNGPGIPDEVLNRVFEPFFTTKPAGHGTGLGLDLSRRIVEAHRGQLTVDSEPGRTVFTATLPAGRSAPTVAGPE